MFSYLSKYERNVIQEKENIFAKYIFQVLIQSISSPLMIQWILEESLKKAKLFLNTLT